MPRFPRASRASAAALGLCLLLLADGPALLPGHGVSAAKERAGADGQPVADAVVCAQGFTDIESKAEMSLHGVTLVPRGAIAVGYGRRQSPGHNGVRAPATLVHRGTAWERVSTRGPGTEDGLMAVATGKGGTWAVGFTTQGPYVKPLAMRWNGKEWTTDRPRVGAPVAVFTDVIVVGSGSPFAIGYRMADDGQRKPLVLRKDGPRWRSVPMAVGGNESVSLLATAPDGRTGIWVVGHGGAGERVKPLIYHREDGKWTRHKVPAVRGEAVLTDVVATSRHGSWAVGYERPDGQARPLVLRWDGKRWKRTKAPDFGSTDVLLQAVSADPAGGIWVVGAAWDDGRKDYEAVAAWWDGRAWNQTIGRIGGTELNDVAGSLADDGWAAGRSGSSGRLVRVCTPPQAGLFGSAEGASAATGGETDDDVDEPLLGGTEEEPEALDADDLEADSAEAGSSQQKRADLRKAGRKPKGRTGKIGTLPEATTSNRIVARDVARPAGVYEDTGTYDAVVADFDGDGVDDLLIGRHGRKARLLLNRGGRFVDHEVLDVGTIDRHGCTAADIDGSGLPDLYCAVGGKRGSGLKSNELWLDPGGSAPVEVASTRGVSDPTGRGRLSAFLESGRRKAVDLVVANSPTRVDGLPSLARLFRANAKGRFKPLTATGLSPRLGAQALVEADFDADGREDLLLVTGGPQSPEPGGTRLYRNTRKGLVDVTRKMAIRPFGEQDAELVDLNEDGRLDLVQLSDRKLKVSLQKKGVFKKVYERNLTDGRAIAGGDVNGDGQGDLYVVRSGSRGNSPDVMLVNINRGHDWKSLVIPQVSGGGGDDAYAIDHDGNGLDDFLVLNGHNLRGPTQLIAFYPR